MSKIDEIAKRLEVAINDVESAPDKFTIRIGFLHEILDLLKSLSNN